MEENVIKIIFISIVSNLIIESKTYMASSFDSQNLDIFNSTSVLERNLIGTLRVITMTGCAMRCISTRSCFSFFFNDEIPLCSLHSQDLKTQ